MCRLLGWVARSELTLRDVLGEQSVVAFAQLSRIHADGWGVAADDGDGIGVQRSTTNASTDPAFNRMASTVGTRAALAHLRWASPGLPVELGNAHPFLAEGTAFAHNGGIYPFERLPELLPERWRDRLTGTTDSEHYFLAVLAEQVASGVDVPTAIGRVLARIAADYAPSSLNAMMLTPDAFYVVNCHDESLRPVLPPPEEQSVDDLVEATEQEVPYYDLRYRSTPDCVVAASSGFAQPEGDGWRRIENNSVLVVDRQTLEVTELPLDVRLQRSGAVEGAATDLR